MSALSFRVPAGFTVTVGDLSALAQASADASSTEIEALHMGEDLCIVDHLLLDAAVHLDARADAFHISVRSGGEGRTIVERAAATWGAAIRCCEDTLREIWSFAIPWREEDTIYVPPAAGAGAADATWIVTGGWTIVLDHLSRPPAEAALADPMRAVFVATSSHRSIAVYEVERAGTTPPYVGLLWAEPVGRLYERVFFPDAPAVAAWLRTRLRHGALPRQKKRK